MDHHISLSPTVILCLVGYATASSTPNHLSNVYVILECFAVSVCVCLSVHACVMDGAVEKLLTPATLLVSVQQQFLVHISKICMQK